MKKYSTYGGNHTAIYKGSMIREILSTDQKKFYYSNLIKKFYKLCKLTAYFPEAMMSKDVFFTCRNFILHVTRTSI